MLPRGARGLPQGRPPEFAPQLRTLTDIRKADFASFATGALVRGHRDPGVSSLYDSSSTKSRPSARYAGERLPRFFIAGG